MNLVKAAKYRVLTSRMCYQMKVSCRHIYMCTGRPVLTALNTIPFNVQDMNYEKKNLKIKIHVLL